MGCGASAPVQSIDAKVEIGKTDEKGVTYVEQGKTRHEVVKENLTIAESDAVKAKAGNETFIASVLKARAEAADNAEIMTDCCARLATWPADAG